MNLTRWSSGLGRRLVIVGPDGEMLLPEPSWLLPGEISDSFEMWRLAGPLKSRRRALKLSQKALRRLVGVSGSSILFWKPPASLRDRLHRLLCNLKNYLMAVLGWIRPLAPCRSRLPESSATLKVVGQDAGATGCVGAPRAGPQALPTAVCCRPLACRLPDSTTGAGPIRTSQGRCEVDRSRANNRYRSSGL